MSLKVAAEVIVKRTCTIRVPRDGTAHRDEQVKINFRIMKNAEEDALWAATMVPPLREDFSAEADFRRAMRDYEANQRKYARQLLTQVVAGWDEDSNITDAKDEPLPFSPEALSDLLDLPYAVNGLSKAYHDAVAGKSGAKGN